MTFVCYLVQALLADFVANIWINVGQPRHPNAVGLVEAPAAPIKQVGSPKLKLVTDRSVEEEEELLGNRTQITSSLHLKIVFRTDCLPFPWLESQEPLSEELGNVRVHGDIPAERSDIQPVE